MCVVRIAEGGMNGSVTLMTCHQVLVYVSTIGPDTTIHPVAYSSIATNQITLCIR